MLEEKIRQWEKEKNVIPNISSRQESLQKSQLDILIKKEYSLELEQQYSNNQHLIQPQDTSQDVKKWNLQDNQLLLNFHDLLGNRWTEISEQFSNKNHNSVKNRFYAQLRKSIRRLNYFIRNSQLPHFKEFNIGLVSKLITLMSEKTHPQPVIIKILAHKEPAFLLMKRKLYFYSMNIETQTAYSSQQICFLITQINEFIEQAKSVNLLGKKKKKVIKRNQTKSISPTTNVSSPKQENKMNGGESISPFNTCLYWNQNYFINPWISFAPFNQNMNFVGYIPMPNQTFS